MKQACEYGAGLVKEFTDSYEDSIEFKVAMIHKPLVRRIVIAYLNRMRATMNQLRRMKEGCDHA